MYVDTSVCTFFILTEKKVRQGVVDYSVSWLSWQSISFQLSALKFNFYALNFNFLYCLGLNDVLSANERAEIFACILQTKTHECGQGFNWNESKHNTNFCFCMPLCVEHGSVEVSTKANKVCDSSGTFFFNSNISNYLIRLSYDVKNYADRLLSLFIQNNSWET